MKICRFDEDRLGVVIGAMVHDVTKAQDEIRAAARYDMKGDAVIAALPQWRKRLEEMAAKTPGKPVSGVKLLPPVARPSKTMAAPVNYAKHVAEMAVRTDIRTEEQKQVKRPSKIAEQGIFLKANSAIVGASEGIPIRFPERINEHELELVVIIGKKGSDIPKEEALQYVAGYALGFDMTTRGSEDRSFRKSIDGYAPVGPWLVTADEFGDPSDVTATLHVNDELRQTANTRELIFDVPRLIEFASSFYTLHPGDIYFTGSPAGVGPVKPGDVLRARCDRIGELEIKARAHEIRA
ncbi:MAG TPA: fumarylacetoacetate hydrolase family protein [Xanthobacteraceae bacterium]|jgi:2-keto-4-pentenoate hydratase/2-oxohepta-3-ene-1,7-dioic acid hydratase in catechol pathway|nr:fumarylacetoacetate hydrolase family protein [Xanthobacteraceae bacterium]